MKQVGWLKSSNFVAFAAIIAIGMLLPVIARSGFVLHILMLAYAWIVMTMGYNLLYGYTGLLSLGQAAFIAIGGYSSTLLVMHLGVPWPLGLLFGGISAGVFAALIGLAVLRLRGVYFALVSFGFAEVVRQTILNWVSLTNGPLGITGVPQMFRSPTATYYVFFLIMVAAIVFLYGIIHSRIGRALIAIREDEAIAASIGINVFYYKLVAYVISAILCGLCGSMMVHYLGYCYPELGHFLGSADMLIYTVVGGRGSFIGPPVAALIFTFFPEMFRFIGEYRPLIYGLILVVVIIQLPRGLEPTVRSLLTKARTRVKSLRGVA